MTDKIEKLLTTIPFSGFYETSWSDYDHYLYIDLEMISEEELATEGTSTAEVQASIDAINHKATREAIASEYVTQFNHYYDTSLEFESLQSPREYNFATDIIFCKISLSELERLFSELDLKILGEVIKGKFTSCSGFISFYSNDLDTWQLDDLASLDCNEIGTLIEAWLFTKHFEFLTHGNCELAIESDILDACLIHEKIVFED
jgi:hypothetical protein